ncbi:MAG: LPP20 family lipoprotein, partial [Treponema sp.]|nr:LPP20 family lipoprotein [Treponema sp.]
MRTIASFVLKCGIIILLSACASIPTSVETGASASSRGNSGAEAEAAAQAALNAMNNGGQPVPGGDSSSGRNAPLPQAPSAAQSQQQPSASATAGGKPLWIDSADPAYAVYITRAGLGASRDQADQKALSELVAYFRQSIQSETTLTSSYSEARAGNSVRTESGVRMDEAIRISSQLDALEGAVIAARWYDGKNAYYSLATMNKAETIRIYTELVNANLNAINNLLNMTKAEKESFDGYLQYQQAAALADKNQAYASVLSVAGDKSNIRGNLKTGFEYRNEARTTVIPKIPIGVIVNPATPNVNSIRAGAIEEAFSNAITKTGFQGGTPRSRYILTVDVALEEVPYPNNATKFSRLSLNASLRDTQTGNKLIAYGFNPPLREGHTTLAEAENWCVRSAVTKIGHAQDGFGKKLSD